MNIVGVTACTVGIAHTYIAQKKVEIAAKKAGHNVKIETQRHYRYRECLNR